MMKKHLAMVLLLLFSFSAVSVLAETNVAQNGDFPDLLEEDQNEHTSGIDLLADDLFFDNTDPFGPGDLSGDVYDPLEPMNRVFFEFNDKLYYWVFKPVKSVYSQLLPGDIRYCIGNFFTNIAAPIRFANNLLQGEFQDAGIVAGRFVINTIFGVAGFGDPAYRDFDIEPRGADFGQTLGKWGLGEGLYLFWPGVGPSTLRDTAGIVGDIYLHPVQYIYSDYLTKTAYFAFDKVNVLSLSPDVYDELKRISLDPYIASREAYYEYRRSIIAKE